MKNMMILVALFMSCVMALGEVSEDRLKDLEHLITIDRVTNRTDKGGRSPAEELKIEYSSENRGLEEVVFRIAVELTDSEKNTYLVMASRAYGRFSGSYAGEGTLALRIPYGSHRRLKIAGYAAENGVIDGEKFVPFAGKYDHVKTYEELTRRTTTPFPMRCKLGITSYVH